MEGVVETFYRKKAAAADAGPLLDKAIVCWSDCFEQRNNVMLIGSIKSHEKYSLDTYHNNKSSS